MPRRLVLLFCMTPAAVRSLSSPRSSPRKIATLEKPIRLPVWPVVNGLACTALDLVGLSGVASSVEEAYGGRVAPMSLRPEADPFVLLVHHRHGFDAWDPIRPVFESLIGLPEGFPAHPHRGFETVTMTIQGGLSHRDSIGIKQVYGDGDVQWLTARSGILHEEMWWWKDRTTRGECELYQLWLNTPSSESSGSPAVEVLRDADLTRRTRDGVLETALSGGADGDATPGARAGPRRPDVSLKRVELAPGATYVADVRASATALVYTRRGSVSLGDGEDVPLHHLAYTHRGASRLDVANLSNDQTAEILLLVGDPLNEPVAASGTWVVSNDAELRQADADYAAGLLGRPWPHTLSDGDWAAWTKDHGSVY